MQVPSKNSPALFVKISNIKKTKVMCISHQGNHKIKTLVEAQRVNKLHSSSTWETLFRMVVTARKICAVELTWQSKPLWTKKHLLTGKWDIKLKYSVKSCSLWCWDMDNDAGRQRKVISIWNVGLEENGKRPLGG